MNSTELDKVNVLYTACNGSKRSSEVAGSWQRCRPPAAACRSVYLVVGSLGLTRSVPDVLLIAQDRAVTVVQVTDYYLFVNAFLCVSGYNNCLIISSLLPVYKAVISITAVNDYKILIGKFLGIRRFLRHVSMFRMVV